MRLRRRNLPLGNTDNLLALLRDKWRGEVAATSHFATGEQFGLAFAIFG